MSDERAFLEKWQSDPQIRQSFVTELIRELSKTGSLEAFEHYLVLLSERLSKVDAVKLFVDLQQSKRPEFERKHEFLDIFSSVSESDLPPAIISEEDARRIMEDIRSSCEFGQPQLGLPDVPF